MFLPSCAADAAPPATAAASRLPTADQLAEAADSLLTAAELVLDKGQAVITTVLESSLVNSRLPSQVINALTEIGEKLPMAGPVFVALRHVFNLVQVSSGHAFGCAGCALKIHVLLCMPRRPVCTRLRWQHSESGWRRSPSP